jgi:hypothetical protein
MYVLQVEYPLIYLGVAEMSIQNLLHQIGDLVDVERNLFYMFPI